MAFGNNFVQDKIVLITGASAGIGEACAYRFAEAGSHLFLLQLNILTARRFERLEEIKAKISNSYPNVDVVIYKLDVRDRSAITELFHQLEGKFRNIDVLVNNAGLALGLEEVETTSAEYIDIMIDTNVKGLLAMTQAVLPIMKSRQSGHIINISSISGKEVYCKGSIYCGTKHFVNAVTKALRMELNSTPIRVSEINPGIVETEFSKVRFNDEDKARKVYENMNALHGDDIADAVLYVASRPPHVQIAEMDVFSVNQANYFKIHYKE